MRLWMRRLGYGLMAVAVLLVLALAALYLTTNARLHRRYAPPDAEIGAARDSASLARGRHLVEAVGICQECHGDDYGGQVLTDSPVFGRLVGANITPGRGGIATYTDADWERALRRGVGRDGLPLVFMPAEAYASLSDADLAAMIGYLRGLSPVDREVPGMSVGPIARALYLRGDFPLIPAEIVLRRPPPPPPSPGATVEYGRYLATVGGCRGCHGGDLAGTGAPGAPDLTRVRLEAWTERDFIRSLREGRRPDGTIIDPTRMPWIRFGRMTDDEMRATWRYIRSLQG